MWQKQDRKGREKANVHKPIELWPLSFFIRNEEKPSAVYNPVKLTRHRRSSLTDRYPQVFVESVREVSLPLHDEKESVQGKSVNCAKISNSR